MNLVFYKNKGLSIILLLVCIIGSLTLDIAMKPKEGFQEGATNKTKESTLKTEITKILSSTDTPKDQCKQILKIIGDYLINEEKTNTTINQIMNILGMNTTDEKKINLISTLLTSDTS